MHKQVKIVSKYPLNEDLELIRQLKCDPYKSSNLEKDFSILLNELETLKTDTNNSDLHSDMQKNIEITTTYHFD